MKKTNLRVILYTICVIALSMCLLTSCSSGTPTTASTTYSLTCKSCGREFSDSTNKKSIRSTNMCSNCYKNYSYASGLKK